MTENLRKNSFKLFPNSLINVSYKLHGTSAIFGNILHERTITPKWYEKLFGHKTRVETYYDYIASSRKVIKRSEVKDTGFYKEDIWNTVLQEIKHTIPKGFIVYGEIVGQMPSGQHIQKDYDYGCENGQHAFMPYRIKMINQDGIEIELSPEQINEYSRKNGLLEMPLFYTGSVLNHYKELMVHSLVPDDKYLDFMNTYSNILEQPYNIPEEVLQEFQTNYIEMLELVYNEKDCYMCKNKVPEEGIIIRFTKHLNRFEAYKLKSFRFLGLESSNADKGVTDIEDEQSQEII